MVLENKLGIIESLVLVREEERLSKKKVIKLFTDELLKNKEVGKFSTLAFIHQYLFEEIYDFAGKVRNVNIEDVPKDLKFNKVLMRTHRRSGLFISKFAL